MPHDAPSHTPSPPRRTLTLDVEKYQRMLDTTDLCEVDKTALIEALWSFVASFMDLGYLVGPIESCGKPVETTSKSARNTRSVVLSKPIPKHQLFASVANGDTKNREAS